jgi:hypothetical protein
MKFVSALVLTMSLSAAAFAAPSQVTESKEKYLTDAANVEYVERLSKSGMDAKIFTIVGDAAMNGVYVNLAVYSQMDGWRVFSLANTADFKVLNVSKNTVKIKIVRDDLDENGDVTKKKKSLMTVSFDKADETGVITVDEKPLY